MAEELRQSETLQENDGTPIAVGVSHLGYS